MSSKEYHAKYRAENKVKIAAIKQKSWQKNKDKYNAKRRDKYLENTDNYRTNNKEYYQRQRDNLTDVYVNRILGVNAPQQIKEAEKANLKLKRQLYGNQKS